MCKDGNCIEVSEYLGGMNPNMYAGAVGMADQIAHGIIRRVVDVVPYTEIIAGDQPKPTIAIEQSQPAPLTTI